MAAISWKNALSGSWGTAANWTGGVIPDSTSADATIAIAGSYAVTLETGAAYTLDSFLINDAAATFDLLGTLDLGGTLASSTLHAGTFVLGSTGALHGTTNNGSVTISSGTVFDLDDTGAHFAAEFSGIDRLRNYGLLELTGTGKDVVSILAPLISTGTILAAEGGLNFEDGGQFDGVLAGAGAITLAAGFEYLDAASITVGTLDVTGGTLVLQANEVVSGAFVNTIGGVLDLNGFNLTLAGNSELTSSQLMGNGTLVVTGTSTFSGPTVAPPGQRPVADAVHTGPLFDDGSILLTGELQVTSGTAGGAGLLISPVPINDTETGFSQAVFDIENGVIGGDEAEGSISNGGVLETNSQAAIEYTFTNTGTVIALGNGTLVFENEPVTNAGATLTGGVWEAFGANALIYLDDQLAPVTTDDAYIILSVAGSELESGVIKPTSIEASLTSIAVGGTLANLNDRVYSTANTLTDSGTIVLGGSLAAGALSITSGGVLRGFGTVSGPVQNNGTIFGEIGNEQKALTIDNAIGGTGTIILNANPIPVVLNGSVSSGQTVIFADTDQSILGLGDPGQFNGLLSGFAAGDTVDLAGLVYAGNVSATIGGTGALQIQEGTVTDTIHFVAADAGKTIYFESDGAGGTELVRTNPGGNGGSPPVLLPAGNAPSGVQIGSGDSEILLPGAKASGATISQNGALAVLAGGTLYSDTINGGVSDVLGASFDTKVNPGGYELVGSPGYGGYADNTVVEEGAYQYVLDGASASNTTLTADATMLIGVGGTASNSVDFAGSRAVLSVAGTVLPAAVLSGFDKNGASDDAIILTGFTYAAGQDSATLGSHGVVTLDLGGVIEQLHFNAGESNAGLSFAVTTNSLDQVVVIDPATVGAGSTTDLGFLAPATAAGSTPIMQQVLGRSAGLFLDYNENSISSAAFQPALKNFTAIPTLDTLSSPAAGASLQSLKLPPNVVTLIQKLTA